MTGRILVVDDDAIVRRVLERGLAQLGYAVETAADGNIALERILAASSEESPLIDLMLLDVVMPVMDGVATLQALASDPTVVNLPVIVVSGLDEQETVVRCLELGAIDYLHKPVDPRLLDVRVRTSLTAKRAREVELDRLDQVDRLMAAARAVEQGSFEPQQLDPVAARGDELGALARTLQRMTHEVAARERVLRTAVAGLRIEIDAARRDRQVEDVTGSAYYRRLTADAAELKRILHTPRAADVDTAGGRP
jgi:DNA-binding response OmpR family regulator